jgi:hypothetical protein
MVTGAVAIVDDCQKMAVVRQAIQGEIVPHDITTIPGFADLIVTGLIGVRPEPGKSFTVHPLIPPGI